MRLLYKTKCFHSTLFILHHITSHQIKSQNNVASGADRVGFYLTADSCPEDTANATIANNVAHACLVGMVLTPSGAPCSSAHGLVAYHVWDYGLLTLKGINTPKLELTGAVIADFKNVGILVQVKLDYITHGS